MRGATRGCEWFLCLGKLQKLAQLQNPQLSPPGMGQPDGPFPVPPLSCVWGQMLWPSWPAEEIKSGLSSHLSISVCESAEGISFPYLKCVGCPEISRAPRLGACPTWLLGREIFAGPLNKPQPRPGHKKVAKTPMTPQSKSLMS